MGIYIDPPAKSKRRWLAENGRKLESESDLLAFDARVERPVFWQPAPWGENAALAYDRTELYRLQRSRVFDEIYVVPNSALACCVSPSTLKSWS